MASLPQTEPSAKISSLWRAIGIERSLVWLALTVLFAIEMVSLTLPFNADARMTDPSLSTQLLLGFQHSLRPVFLTGVAVMLLMSWKSLREELLGTLMELGPSRLLSWRWLGLHLLCLAFLGGSTLLRRASPAASTLEWQLGLIFWALVALVALISWCCTLLPPNFWLRWLRQSRTAIAAGLGVGFAAFLLGNSIAELWWPLQRITFVMVVGLLHLLRQPVQLDPDKFIISLGDFSALVGPACSGVEGVALIIVAVAAYLWYAREDLKFPSAILLIPIGMIAIWLFNVARIAALIWIGSWSSDAGVKGFHSVAGWLLFNLVACGLIATSSRFGLFARHRANIKVSNPATAYLMPLIAVFLGATTDQAFAASTGADLVYLAGLTAALLIIWSYQRELRSITQNLRPSLLPLFAGVAVGAIWFTLERRAALIQMLCASSEMVHSTHAPRTIAILAFATIIVPLAEGLALRGYLARRLIAPEFEDLPYSSFTPVSFGGTVVAFALLNGVTFPALLAGAVFIGLSYRRGHLADLISAHITCGITALACTLIL